ncbi:hypothetical protein U732_2154 [Clostridium argentinense CDC 2741]|uniref:DUF4177 domain-containing protein n=2 Tax=Clostridium argentinense TaxID=29341 RepID=A0A0C1QXT3_9CLOT|nr:hypothetical protein U732_2154 [Clostridium argentinense CDC 2741]
MFMYESKFVKIDLKAGLLSRDSAEDYNKIIENYLKENWKFIQIFAPSTGRYEFLPYFELIFERKIKNFN